MPLAFGPYSLTVIKEDGAELNYATEDFNHSKTIRVKFTYNDSEISETLYYDPHYEWYSHYQVDDNALTYMRSVTYTYNWTIEVGDMIRIDIQSNFIHVRGNSCYSSEYYYHGLDLTLYSQYVPILPYIGVHNNVKLICNLVLVASQLDTSLVDTLLKLC